MGKKITFDEWKERCVKIHNNKYEYLPNDNWVGIKNTIVKIVCPIHSVFEQNADVHQKGFGCKKCSDYSKTYDNKRRFTKEQFIEKAYNVHR